MKWRENIKFIKLWWWWRWRWWCDVAMLKPMVFVMERWWLGWDIMTWNGVLTFSYFILLNILVPLRPNTNWWHSLYVQMYDITFTISLPPYIVKSRDNVGKNIQIRDFHLSHTPKRGCATFTAHTHVTTLIQLSFIKYGGGLRIGYPDPFPNRPQCLHAH